VIDLAKKKTRLVRKS